MQVFLDRSHEHGSYREDEVDRFLHIQHEQPHEFQAQRIHTTLKEKR